MRWKGRRAAPMRARPQAATGPVEVRDDHGVGAPYADARPVTSAVRRVPHCNTNPLLAPAGYRGHLWSCAVPTPSTLISTLWNRTVRPTAAPSRNPFSRSRTLRRYHPVSSRQPSASALWTVAWSWWATLLMRVIARRRERTGPVAAWPALHRPRSSDARTSRGRGLTDLFRRNPHSTAAET